MSLKNNAFFVKIINGSVLCLALMCSLIELSKISVVDSPSSSLFFGLSLIFMACYELLQFYQKKSVRQKIDLFHVLYTVLYLAAAISSFIISNTSKLYILPSFVFLLAPTIKRLLTIIKKHKVHSKVYNILVFVVCLLFLLFTVSFLGSNEPKNYALSSIFACLVIFLTNLVNICAMVFSQFNKEILLRIVHKTYAGEILLGLFLLIIAFSLVFMHNEESVHSFGDGLWYCFAIITTIGFGDITAVSFVGRILTVILGLYGIIVVSILTSIIINFYTEIKDKEESNDAPNKKEDNSSVEKAVSEDEEVNVTEEKTIEQEE